MKNFVNRLNKEGESFKYLTRTFPRLSTAKLKEGIFIGPQIRELMKNTDFDNCLNFLEKAAWQSFKDVTKYFLGNMKSADYSLLTLSSRFLSGNPRRC